MRLCVGSWGLAVGDVLFLESGHQGRCSQGLREGGTDGGGPVRGDTRGRSGGTYVHMLSENQPVVCPRVPSVYLCWWAIWGVEMLCVCVFVPVLCLCARELCACVRVCVRVCVWILSLQDARPSPGLPSKGPRSLSSAAPEQGVQNFSQNPSPQGH